MRIWILGVVILLSGCSSFGRGVAEAILESGEKKDTRQCEIKGSKFNGIDYFFSEGNTVKVMMIHGVGTHNPGYATRIRENLAQRLSLEVMSRRPKDILLLNPDDGKTVLGNLRVTRMQNGERNRTMIFYELTWSDITAAEKELLQYDVSGEYTHKRAAFNNMMKKFLNDTGPDPMIYLMDKDNLILNATKQATCWMLGFNYDELKPEQKKVCLVESYQQIKDMSKENIVFITHSLGSRILVDSFTDIVEQVYAQSRTTRPEAQKIINELKNQELTVYMLANQLPMLQIGRKKPKINNRIPEYCSPKGKHYQDRVFKKGNIVACSDPNDILSYDVPQRFVDTYFDSRMCPAVTNVNLNVAEEISAFGMSVVNPVTAHTEYDNDVRIIEMIAQGTNDFKSNPLLSKKCKMTLLQD